MTYTIGMHPSGTPYIADHSDRSPIGDVWSDRDGNACFVTPDGGPWTASELREIADLLDRAGPSLADPLTPDESETA